MIYRGQDYRFVRERPYQRRDGTMTTLIDWESYCADCRSPFITSTPGRVPDDRAQLKFVRSQNSPTSEGVGKRRKSDKGVGW